MSPLHPAKPRIHRLAGMASVLFGLATGAGLTAPVAAQTAHDPVIRGKNNWLFVRYEIPPAELADEALVSVDLIARLNRLLAAQKITLAVTVVPSKIETYQEQLPDGFKVSDHMRGFNDKIQTALRAAGVPSIDLKGALRSAALKDPANPVFLQLDTHWTPTGAMAAAQTIKAGIDATPSLKVAYDAVLYERYVLQWASAKENQPETRDIIKLLPANAPSYPVEQVLRFTVTRANPVSASLLGASVGGDIVLVGSSFSDEATGFANALRYMLQRDVLNFHIPADLGPWMMMKSYLQNDAFQTQKPKLLLWEIPERAISWAPNYPYRDARYVIDNADWLLQVGALSKETCEPTGIASRFEATGLLAPGNKRIGNATQNGDFLELSFDQPINRQSYLSARLATPGSEEVTLEASGPGVPTRKFTVKVAGDDTDHAFKTPLALTDKGINRLRIYPGTTRDFALGDIEVCRQSAALVP